MDNTEGELLETVTITADESDSPYLVQRINVDNAQLLGSELLQHHNGIVVDLAGDFIPVSYTSEDLLSQDLTEEDRNLAAALVAVQLRQQQKQQQSQQDSVIMPLRRHLNVSKHNLDEQTIILEDKEMGYIQINSKNLYKHNDIDTQEEYDELVKNNLDIIKPEINNLISHDSDDNRDLRSAKKSLPHKKRIARKHKKSEKSSPIKIIKCNFCDQMCASNEFSVHQELCQANIASISTVFSCQLCNTGFTDQLQFFEHLKAHYEPIVEEIHEQEQEQHELDLSCNIDREVQLHIKDHDPIKREPGQQQHKEDTLLSSLLQLSCLECNKTFKRQKTYETHMKEYHNDKEEGVLIQFPESDDLMAGLEVDPCIQEVDVVDETKSWYRDDELQATEEDLKELEANDHVCLNCQQPFPIRAILMQHLLTCRPSLTAPKVVAEVKKKVAKKQLECTECDRLFTHRNSLLYHMRSHTGHRPHQCDQCGKSFFAASALKVHLRLHSGDKPYRCEYCGRSFRQWGDLKYHCISLHTDQKQYQCEYCGKDFARKYSLIVHRRIHTGEKNYKCEFCAKTFRASSYLQNHRRIHTGEKPHSCEVCGKRFRVGSDMKRHLRTHSRKRASPKDESSPGTPQQHFTGMDENEAAVQSINYENDPLGNCIQAEEEVMPADDARDDNTLYVMPILIA